jgi:hypothetical protein
MLLLRILKNDTVFKNPLLFVLKPLQGFSSLLFSSLYTHEPGSGMLTDAYCTAKLAEGLMPHNTAHLTLKIWQKNNFQKNIDFE